MVTAASVLVGLGCACACAVSMEPAKPEKHEEKQNAWLAASPWSASRLAASSANAPSAMMVSFLVEAAGGVALHEAIETFAKEKTFPHVALRLRVLLGLALTSLVGTLVAGELQRGLGVRDQAAVASGAHVLTYASLALDAPYLAVFFTLFGRRGADFSDMHLLRHRSDDAGKCETFAALENWRALASVFGVLGAGYARSHAGGDARASFLFLAACACAAERLRRVRLDEPKLWGR
jgi:hypothetical protein